MTVQLVARFTQINEIIQSKSLDYNAKKQEEELPPLDGEDEPSPGNGMNFSFIMDILGLVDQSIFEKGVPSGAQNHSHGKILKPC